MTFFWSVQILENLWGFVNVAKWRKENTESAVHEKIEEKLDKDGNQ